MSKRFPQDLASRAPTIVDVAAAAEVSISTVSRALSGSARVRPALALRVQAAAERLGYVPDRRGRALVQRRSRSIGVVVPTVDNAIFARSINAMQVRLDADGYRLLLASTQYDQGRELASVQALVEHGVDGIALVGAEHHPQVLPLIAARAIPVVSTWGFDPTATTPTIGFDNREAMRRLVGYLLDLGHRRIAMIGGISTGNDRAAARIAGLQDALAAAGLTAVAILERPYTVPDGRVATRLLLDDAHPPTAIVCGNDILAFGALAEAHALGVDVPRRLSITGFDDLDLASHTIPPLTTMRVPAAAMGRHAAEQLLARITGRAAANAVALEAELIVRASTAPPRPSVS